uniref:At1g61320/AtMIF1 LRR domain-containing protein n=1 Tax=Quercus lobata TaxID=97700 RepID=A0A7N2LMJ7_QUELO
MGPISFTSPGGGCLGIAYTAVWAFLLQLRNAEDRVSPQPFPSPRRPLTIRPRQDTPSARVPGPESKMFRECRGLKSIKASNVPKVMAITLEGNALESLELEAFNLYYLSMRQVTIGSGFNLLHCKNLRLLSLCVVYISNEWLNNNLPGLALLEKLELKICFELKTIKISNHHLKSLDLDRCAYLIEVEIDAPKLSTFIYYGTYQASISSNALALSQATYNLRCLNVPDPTDVEKIEFLSKLSNSKLLELSVERAENAIIPKEFRETLPSPSYNVKHLMVSISKSFTRDEIGELVDSLLWISPLPDILSMECSKNSKPDFDQISLKMILLEHFIVLNHIMPSSLNFQVARMSSDFEAREVLEDAKKVSNEAQAKNSSDRIGKISLKVGKEMAYAEDEVLS